MKAISLWQPWASYIAAGMKRYETRHWSTDYRGPLAIHAAKRKLTEDEQSLLEEYPLITPNPPLGAVVATCELVECLRMTDVIIANREKRELELGNWEEGRFAWCLVNVVPLAPPVPYRGAQGLFEVPPPGGALPMNYEDREREEWRDRQDRYRELERQNRHAEASDLRYENFGRDSDAAFDDWASR